MQKRLPDRADLYYIKPEVNWAKYTKLWITPVELWKSDDPDSSMGKISADNQQKLIDLFHTSMSNALQKYCQIVTAGGQDVPVIHAAQPDARKSKPAATVDRRVGTKALRTQPNSTWGDVKLSFGWSAQRFNPRLIEEKTGSVTKTALGGLGREVVPGNLQTNTIRRPGSAARCVALVLWLALAWIALPTAAPGDVLVATNGERFVGKVIVETADTVVFESELGGRLTLLRAQVRELQRQPPGESAGTIPLTNQVSTPGLQPSTNQWLPPNLGQGSLDWIQLKSGSWLSGRFKYLQNRKLEFDNDELDEQTFKLKDIRQIYPASPAWARFDSRKEPAFGTVVVSNEVVSVSGPEQILLPRDQLLGLTPSGGRGMHYWSGNFSVGLSLQSGNNRFITLTTSGELARRSPNTDLVLDYLGNYSQVNGIESANNQRLNFTYDIRLDRHWFIRAPQLEYYHDPLANIAHRGTAMVGGGYYIFDRSGLTWNVAAGPAYQYTRFDTVEPDQSDTATTPAAVLETYFKMDLTRRLTFSENLRTIFAKEEAGQYTHHAVSKLEFKIKQHLDFDVSFVWEYLHKPEADSSGEIPQNSDFYLTVGLGYRF